MIPVIYLLLLVSSITIYRLSPFHPLARYPGPVLARISRLWALWRVVNGKQHIDSHELFLRYGDVVRTGPNHLLIRDASVIPALHGSKDRWLRTESELPLTVFLVIEADYNRQDIRFICHTVLEYLCWS